ncbi:MAG: transketolase C-terminal domain-containing protein, partial [Thermodesulfobacteriota bacterium]
VKDLLPQLLELNGPSYMRIGRGREPVYVAKDTAAVLGRCRKLNDGQDVAIVTTGDMASEVVSAVKTLNARDIFPAAYQFHTVKPLDTDSLESIAKKFKRIIVVEENIPQGGIGCAIREWAALRKNRTDIAYLCGPDEFVLGSPHQREIRSKYKFDSSAVAEEALKTAKHKNSGMGA